MASTAISSPRTREVSWFLALVPGQALKCGYSRMRRPASLTLIWYLHCINTDSRSLSSNCVTIEHSKKHAGVQSSQVPFIMTVALLQIKHCLLRTSRNGTLLRRSFQASSPRAIVRPFLLSDIGEGESQLFVLGVLSLSCLRYQRSTDYTMVRRARCTRRAIRQDLRGPV